MEAEAGRAMEDLRGEAEVPAALDERAKWIGELKAAREKPWPKAAGRRRRSSAKAEAVGGEGGAGEGHGRARREERRERAEIAKLIGQRQNRQAEDPAHGAIDQGGERRARADARRRAAGHHQRLLVERLTAQLERQAGAPLLKDADRRSTSTRS